MQQTYVPGNSFLHKLHPLTKLAGAALVLAILYLLTWPFVPLILFVMLLLLAVVSGVSHTLLRVVVRLVLPIAISLFLIQGVLFPPPGAVPFYSVGPIRLTWEGIRFAYDIVSRLVVLTTVILLILKVTHPADLVNALTERGLPRSIGYILLISLQIAPDMSARASAILDAQRSRGLETERGWLRVGALVPLFTPLVVGALADVEERAMALESRAFAAAGPKTVLRVLVDSTAQRVTRLGILILIVALVVLRFTVLWSVL